VICRIEDDVPVGRADLFLIDHPNGSCGFGIGIGDASRRGRGLGTDAVGALVDFAFGELRMERVWLDTEVSNTRAQASYRKAGFTEEGRLRHAWFVDGEHVDGVRMSMLRDEWLALSRPRSWDRTTTASGGE
jgi:RimJ/RimL family protein N-acetyltransferase